ncbi:hypothetical protein CYMTET_49072 [Cymbomonas tetramitiformis]|uniref:DNA N-6-adenine-methyltransferase (Dam) n=1 Tax=Cymbomonas tetramitiformis TaxID=36881 RepID=A0AAE0BS69_9CHLO|nr:hypothetical protein CYMTET_49072 [Cymbomonas tetramitiformis]
MGSTARPPKNGKRKDGTIAFDLPHNLKKGRMVCHTDPLLLQSHTGFKRKLWVLAGFVLDYLDPGYKDGGWALYASCKDDAAEIEWHQDKNDVQYQYWAKLGTFENEFVDFGGSENQDKTHSFFGSREEVLAEKGTIDWMVRRSVYLQSSAFNPHGICHVDLYTDGKPYPEGNSQCEAFYSLDDPAEDHSWHGGAFWANPPYLNALIHRMLTKMLKDFWKDPNNTSFTVVLRRSETATWWPLTYFFQEIDNIPAGTTGLFSRPRAGTYDPEALTDAAEEGGADRVFIQGTPFDTVVLYKDATTVPRIDPNQYLHTCLGHCSAEYVIHLIKQGVKFCVNSQRISPRTLSTLLNDCGCAHCHAANTHRLGPFNTFTKAILQSST